MSNDEINDTEVPPIVKIFAEKQAERNDNVRVIRPEWESKFKKINEKIIDYNDFINSKLKPIEYVVYPILPTQGIGFIYAATGVGKTFFTLNLAFSISKGGDFLKYKCPLPRRVLYVDGEMAFNQLHQRINQIAKQQGGSYYPTHLNILTPDKILPFAMPEIDTEEGQTTYDSLIEERKIEVVVFDNVSVLSSFDENKSAEWKLIQKWLLKLRSNGKSIILVHHAGKDKNGYRGTSKMLDCVDFAISLQPIQEDGDSYTGKKFKIDYQKARSFYGSEAQPYEATLENGIWSFRTMNMSLIDQLVQCVNAKMTQRDIAKELGINLSRTHRLIQQARFEGKIS